MSKKKKMYMVTIIMSCMLMLSGCGRGEDTAQEQGLVEVTAEPLASVALLTELQDAEGQQSALESEEALRREAQLLLTNLELEEYRDEAVNMIINPAWQDIVFGALTEEQSAFYLEQDGRTVLTVTAGYSETGKAFTRVIYTPDEAFLICIESDGEQLQWLQAGMGDGVYDGEYEKWTLNAATGDVVHEVGTYDRGQLKGEAVVKVHYGESPVDLYALWCHRETMKFETATAAEGTPVRVPEPTPQETPGPGEGTLSEPQATQAPDVTATPKPLNTPTPGATTTPKPQITPAPDLTTSPTPDATTEKDEPTVGDVDIEYSDDIL